LDNRGSIFKLLTIGAWHELQIGTDANAKLSLIQPTQPSFSQDQIVVFSSGISSNDFFRKYMISLLHGFKKKSAPNTKLRAAVVHFKL